MSDLPTPDAQLSKADAIALEYLQERSSNGRELSLIEQASVCAFSAWVMRNFDVYKLDEVNRG